MPKPAKKTAQPAKKAAAPRAAGNSLTIKGTLKLGDQPIVCPGRTSAPRKLTLMISGTEAHLSCGERHAGEGEHARRIAKCFFTNPHLTGPVVSTLIAQTEPGRPFRFRLPTGLNLQGVRAKDAKPPRTGTSAITGAHQARRAAARKTAAGGGRPGPRRSGGTLAAGFGTLTAAFNAVGQTAGALGRTAGAVGKVADMGREGLRTGRAAIDAADSAGARRFARDNQRTSKEGGDSDAG